MNLRCAIIDDEPLALGLLESYVRKTPSLELCGRYSSAIQAMQALSEQPVDLLFLDIQMPELSGLEFSRMIPESTRIVFTTAFGQYALDGYKVNALHYLLKPISYNDFMEAVNKAIQWFELRRKAEGNNHYKFEDEQGKHTFWHTSADRKSTRLNSSHVALSRMPSSA